MTLVETYVDPSCPWAWITSRWLTEVAPQRGLELRWPSYCLEIRDDYGVAPTVPPERRDAVIAGHALSHRMLRVFEAVRAMADEAAIDALYAEWGRRFFVPGPAKDDAIIVASLVACGLDASLLDAADDEKWDAPIMTSMEIACEYAGPKSQTPVIVVQADPPYGFKGPVMAPAPTGDAAIRMWDAINVLARESGFYEFTRPRRNRPTVTFNS